MEKQNIYTSLLSQDQEKKLYDAWHDTEVKAPPYAKWQLRPENCVITCYTSGKTVFQGRDAAVYASAFINTEAHPIPQKSSTQKKPGSFPQAGSDEVGTGDYFGPVCVCATIVSPEDLSLLQELGVRDSKQLNDDDIRRIAPKIMKQIPYSLLILEPAKYNEVHKDNNMNAIKSKLHNQAYVNLTKKYQLPSLKVIDQFTPENLYYRYLKGEKEIIRGIHFETKAEDKYPAVGAGSVIARYAFLTRMDDMEKKWKMSFQKGAGTKVDACAKEFIRKYSFDELSEIAKMHFKNTERL
ncbi:MAG: ribonuclease HIII [Erysipelotrichaceae bacterium]|jgi:ribonuclease HIII|nr:ribonuclease HIII [Erysipelotrichaceae bacterium]